MTLIFDPLRSSKVKYDDAKWSNLVSHHFQDISNQRILTLTYNLSRSSKVKPIGSLYNLRWVEHRNCAVLGISRQKV